jgi:ABC-2 type transport system ATP-binding protein
MDCALLAVKVESLQCYIDSRQILSEVSFEVPKSSVFVLLGPNGAGKTTTLNAIAGVSRTIKGTIQIAGNDLASKPIAAKRLMAFMPDEPMLYEVLTPIEYLEFIAALWKMDIEVAKQRSHELLEKLSLSDEQNNRIYSLSRGMRQKLALAGALLHEPSVLIMDEPFTGLDPVSSRHIRTMICETVAQGTAVVMSTHMMALADQLATHIAIIERGRVLTSGAIGDVKRAASKPGTSLEDLYISLLGNVQ